MKSCSGVLALAGALLLIVTGQLDAQLSLMENVGRGVVAIRSTATDVVVSWRVLGTSAGFTVAAAAPIQPYLRVPLQVPPGGTTPAGEAYTCSPNDTSVGDLNGDASTTSSSNGIRPTRKTTRRAATPARSISTPTRRPGHGCGASTLDPTSAPAHITRSSLSTISTATAARKSPARPPMVRSTVQAM
jgi:hypothetical protein